MADRRLPSRGVLVALVVAAVVAYLARRTWTDHDVSDPGVTL